MSIAVTGSGGAGSITAGELLLSLAGPNGCFGIMRRSFGPQIRGGEAAALVRLGPRPIEGMNDSFDLWLALDWQNADRFADEIPLRPDSLIIADPDAGETPAVVRELGLEVIAVPMKALAKDIEMGRPNMVALGLLAHWLDFCADEAGRLIEHTFGRKGEAIVGGSGAAFEAGFAGPNIVEKERSRMNPQSMGYPILSARPSRPCGRTMRTTARITSATMFFTSASMNSVDRLMTRPTMIEPSKAP